MIGAAGARAVVLVEGRSDEAALHALAGRLGRDLDAEQVAIQVIGGAHALARHAIGSGPPGSGRLIAGLYDVAEERVVRRGLIRAGLLDPDRSAAGAPAELEPLGFYACVADLEEELLRAVGVTGMTALLAEQGDLDRFRRLQTQVAWRGRPEESQMRRFLGSGAGRKPRYARLLVAAAPDHRLPAPLVGVLDHVAPAIR